MFLSSIYYYECINCKLVTANPERTETVLNSRCDFLKEYNLHIQLRVLQTNPVLTSHISTSPAKSNNSSNDIDLIKTNPVLTSHISTSPAKSNNSSNDIDLIQTNPVLTSHISTSPINSTNKINHFQVDPVNILTSETSPLNFISKKSRVIIFRFN